MNLKSISAKLDAGHHDICYTTNIMGNLVVKNSIYSSAFFKFFTILHTTTSRSDYHKSQWQELLKNQSYEPDFQLYFKIFLVDLTCGAAFAAFGICMRLGMKWRELQGRKGSTTGISPNGSTKKPG